MHEEPRINISIYVGKLSSGIFVRSGREDPPEPVAQLLEPHRQELETSLGTELGPSERGGHFLARSFPKGHAHHNDWDEIITWMEARLGEYRVALSSALDGTA